MVPSGAVILTLLKARACWPVMNRLNITSNMEGATSLIFIVGNSSTKGHGAEAYRQMIPKVLG
jgi:hypothetical protein